MEKGTTKLTVNGYISIALLLQVTVLLVRLFGTIIYGNYALLFESFHILTDIIVTGVVFASIKISSSNFSQRYAYGLYRIEDLVSLFIAVLIAFTAIDLLKTAFAVHPSSDLQSSIIQLISVVPLFFSGIVKIVGGRRMNSPSLTSDGYHNYSDVYVGIGVGLGLALSYVTHLAVFYFAAITVAAIGIFYTSLIIGRDGIIGIMDLPKDKKTILKINEIVRENPRVTDVKSIKARWAGAVIFVEIVLRVNSRLTLEEAHDVADEVEERLLKDISYVKDVVIHLEPSRQSKRVIMIPLSSGNEISEKSSKSNRYLVVNTNEGKRMGSKNIEIPSEKSAQKLLSLAEENGVTDIIVLGAGEILLSLSTTNHIALWKAVSVSVDDNIDLFLQNRLTKLLVT